MATRTKFEKTWTKLDKLKISDSDFIVATDIQFKDKVTKQLVNTKLFTSFPSHAEYINWFNKHLPKVNVNSFATFYEVTNENNIKFFLDLDIDHKLDEHNAILSEAIQTSIDVFDDLCDLELRPEDFVVCSSHRADKKSYHVILPKFKFATKDELKFVVKAIHSNMPTYSEFLDHGIYTKGRQFRIINCYKLGKDNKKVINHTWMFNDEEIQLELLNEGDVPFEVVELEATLISHTPDCDLVQAKGYNVKEDREITEVNLTDGEISKVDSIIMEYIGDDFEIKEHKGSFVNLVRKRPTLCEVCNRTHDSENPYITVTKSASATFVRFCCRRSPESVIIGRINHPTGCFPVDDYYLNDFIDKWATKPFPYGTDLSEMFLDAKKVIAIVNQGKRMIITKDNVNTPAALTSFNSFSSAYFGVGVVVEPNPESKDKPKSISMVSIASLFRYAGVQNLPYHEHEDLSRISDYNPKLFNMFNRFKGSLKTKDKINQNVVATFERHVFEVLAGGVKENFNYIMKWFAKFITTPRNKAGQTCLVYYSPEQQVGKNILTDFIREWVLGPSLAIDIDGLNSITSKFNAQYAGKLLITINECPANKDTYRPQWETMKSRITAKVNKCEPKGLDSYSIQDYTRYIITTNNSNAILVEDSDRRYAIFHVSDKYRGNVEYFDNFDRVMNNKDAGDDILSHLYYYDTKGFNMQNDIPETEIRSTMKKHAESKPVMFIREIQDPHYESIEHRSTQCANPPPDKWVDYRKDGMLTVPKDVLYKEYQEWSKMYGFGIPLNINTFYKEVAKLTNDTRVGPRGKQVCSKVIQMIQEE